jgi:hypothetical protein
MTFAFSSSALFYLTSASPLSARAQQVNIVVQNGDSDSATGITVDINSIAPTSQVGGSAGVSAATLDQGVTCQAFKDANGETPLDGPFSLGNTVFFNNCAANGDATSCVIADAVPIGAYCCAAVNSFNATCLAKVNNGGGNSGGNGDGKIITTQLNGADELAIQTNVPDDASIVVIGGNQSFDSAFIADLGGASGVSCQAFSDTKGTKKVGTPFGTNMISLASGKETLVQAISCTINSSSTNPSSTSRSVSTTVAAAPTASAPTASTTSATGLSLTAQLFLADTAVDRFALLPDDTQFVFDFGNPALKGKGGNGGDLIAANRKTFPALVGTGAGMAVGFLGPCGFNTPHVHPRSVELQIVTSGRLVTEMLPENGVFNGNLAANGRRVINNTITEFQMQPFYQGSVHTQFNPDCTNTTFVAAFTSEDFGAGQIADELFAMSPDVVSAAFGQAIDGADVAKFKAAIPTSIAEGVEQCLKTCGIAKR